MAAYLWLKTGDSFKLHDAAANADVGLTIRFDAKAKAFLLVGRGVKDAFTSLQEAQAAGFDHAEKIAPKVQTEDEA